MIDKMAVVVFYLQLFTLFFYSKHRNFSRFIVETSTVPPFQRNYKLTIKAKMARRYQLKKQTIKRWLSLLIGLALLLYFFHFQNNSIVTSEYTISSDKVPHNFNGFKIVQLSDLHSKSFGNDQSDLVNKVKKSQADLILFTGDLVDSNRYNEESSLILMEKLVEIAPVYYVTGNHEWWSGQFNTLEDQLKTLVCTL